MKYYNYDIVFQEIPDEVTLAVNITNCPNRCQGCHSPHLWEDTGMPLTEGEIDRLMARYGTQITCFCFMGGDGQMAELERLAAHLRQHYRVKTAWYSGQYDFPKRLELFDFVKTGPYLRERGGLKSPGTNQHLYRIEGAERKKIMRFA
ncbi:MAG: anaerobic ribonucleoside-triphosphate reductase activating protein [Bacteroidales bacterium]|nr:anaerobic ribonucleoside-triphosphate reductase activating protein [Bacteroidales bacterium]MBP5614319.1 anaerobic ribonucleoside-triphosphate reductase activating protein [Bacteroidales bacterium]MBR4492100.1 anaerobic ribonucleoside-triphosphate reductase activating protein [Bacteroidales bacterium]MBR5665956.1 anaerobic ribonucleoside-triphosphate reductase activating protein [Bacteroidales bacterium]